MTSACELTDAHIAEDLTHNMAKKTKLFWEPLTARDKLEHNCGLMAPASLVPGWTSPLHAAHLHFKSEVFLQVLDDHHQER